MLAFSILYLIIEGSCEGSAGLFDLKIPLVKVDKVFLWLFSFSFTSQEGLCAGAQSEALITDLIHSLSYTVYLYLFPLLLRAASSL